MSTQGVNVLAFDIGLKRTGVASGQTRYKTTSPAGQIDVRNGRLDWQQLDKLIAKWQPALLIIGDPESNDPHLAKAINRFKSHIQQHHKLPIVAVSERLTSSAANQALADRGLNQRRKTALRDQIAACLILETYFNSGTVENH